MIPCTVGRRRVSSTRAGGLRTGRLASAHRRPASGRGCSTRHDFEIRVEPAGEVAIIAVRGEVDLDSAVDFSEGLRKAVMKNRGPVVVDLCDVPFMDSTGLHLLLNLLRRLTRQGRRLTVACMPSGVRRLFELTRLDHTFEIYGSRDEALAAIEQGGRLGV